MKKAAGHYFPLGLGYISACVKQKGYDVKFFDPNVQNIKPEQIAEAALHEKPVFIGISFMTPQFAITSEMCSIIKRICPEIPIVLGGAHPSVMPEKTLQEIPDADFVIVNEGEETVVTLLSALQSSKSFDNIKGLVFRKNSEIIMSSPPEPIEDIDSLPMPDRTLIDQSFYRAQSFLSFSSNTASIYTSRGCPGRCVFCCSGHRLRTRIRERSVKSIMKEINYLVETFGIDYLLIKDDTFTLRKSRVEDFCDAIKKEHPKIKWHCMGRVNTVDYNLLSKMKRAGLHDIFFGIESGNDDILKKAKKGITTKAVRSAVSACKDLNIRTYGAFILGLPGDTVETINQTIDFACSLPLTLAGFSILIPYPGTQVFEDYYEIGKNEKIDYSSFIASTGIHYTPNYTGLIGLKPSDLPELVSNAQKRFYLRPIQIFRILRNSNPLMIAGYIRGFTALLKKELYLNKRGKNR
jgi:anaerobic magnesium-protoporphyrin IX monomethyl ester cyclase